MPPAGLCDSCVHQQVVRTRRGPAYSLCLRSRTDPAYPKYPRLPVLVLTTFDTEADILAALDAGAAGYLLKDAPPEEIAGAVHRMAAGRPALGAEVAERLLTRTTGPGAASALSAREIELLELIARGDTNREAARALFLSEATVKTHLVHIFQKLGVATRTEAVHAARERRIIR